MIQQTINISHFIMFQCTTTASPFDCVVRDEAKNGRKRLRCESGVSCWRLSNGLVPWRLLLPSEMFWANVRRWALRKKRSKRKKRVRTMAQEVKICIDDNLKVVSIQRRVHGRQFSLQTRCQKTHESAQKITRSRWNIAFMITVSTESYRSATPRHR